MDLSTVVTVLQTVTAQAGEAAASAITGADIRAAFSFQSLRSHR
jgi:hypothetical protein